MEKVDRTNRSDVKFPTLECGGSVEKVKNVNEIETCSEHPTGWFEISIIVFCLLVIFFFFGGIGVQLLEHYGQLTDKLQKPLKSVPTVVFNGQYKEEDSRLAQNDFVKALCQYIKGAKPADCARNSAITTTSFALTTIFTCLAFHFLF